MRAKAGGELRDNSHPFTSAAVGVSQLYIYTSSKSPSTIQARVHTHTHTHKFIYRFVRGVRAICFRAAMMANNFWTTNKTRPLPHVAPRCARLLRETCKHIMPYNTRIVHRCQLIQPTGTPDPVYVKQRPFRNACACSASSSRCVCVCICMLFKNRPAGRTVSCSVCDQCLTCKPRSPGKMSRTRLLPTHQPPTSHRSIIWLYDIIL